MNTLEDDNIEEIKPTKKEKVRYRCTKCGHESSTLQNFKSHLNNKYPCDKVKTEVDIFKFKLSKLLDRYDNFMTKKHKLGGGEILIEYRKLYSYAYKLFLLLSKLDKKKDTKIIEEYTLLFNRIKELKIF
jgi:hypothetical protein